MSGQLNGRARRISREHGSLSPQLLLVYDFPPMGGGIARWMGELAKRHRPGSLVVSTGSYPGSETTDRVLSNPVDRLPLASSRLRTVQGTWRWSRRVETLARIVSASFVWCGNIKPAAYPARWAKMRAGVPYGIFLHGGDLLILARQTRRSLIKRRTAQSLLGCASVLVANSSWTAQVCHRILQDLGIDAADRVRTVPLGTDPAVFRPGIDQADVRRRYGLDQGRWLLSVARLTRHKGLDTALHVLAELAPGYPDLAYAIVGSGDYLPTLEHLSRTLGVANRVRFLTQVPDSDLPALYNCAEVYLGLSRLMEERVEGFGISLAEASACGLPVIAGRSGGVPEAVRQDETGFLVNPEHPAEIAASLRRLLDNRELALRLGAAGRRSVESYYNWDRVTADVEGIAREYGRVRRLSLPDAR